MKLKTLSMLAVIVVALGLFIAIAIKFSGGTSWLTSMTAPTIESKTYQLETEGFNMRVYTFTHPTLPNTECMSTASSDGAGGSCWKSR